MRICTLCKLCVNLCIYKTQTGDPSIVSTLYYSCIITLHHLLTVNCSSVQWPVCQEEKGICQSKVSCQKWLLFVNVMNQFICLFNEKNC